MKAFKFNIVIMILLFLASARSEAQVTNLIVTISDKDFPERSDWGESLRISSLKFYVNDYLIGTLTAGLTSSSNSTIIYNDFPINNPEVITRIEVTCIYHTWNMFGDKEEIVIHPYPLTTQNLDGSGVAGIRSFSQFIELPMVVNWSFNYQVSITPFKPEIKNETEEICFHHNPLLTLKSFKPDFYTIPVQYEWQYGFFSKQWTENPDFSSYINDVAYSLYSRCSGGPELSCENITGAVINTNYSFMNEYESLYDNPENSQKYEIANHLLDGILMNHTFLSSQEQEFLRSNFIPVVMEKNYWPPPYLSNNVVSSWLPLGVSSNPDGSILFKPVLLVDSTIAEITRVVYQVRSVAPGQNGSFSNPRVFNVKPKAPVFNVTVEPSCSTKITGVIKLSNVSGVVSGYKSAVTYKYLDPQGNPIPVIDEEDFYGPDYTLTQKIRPGEYNLDVYYIDPNFNGCSFTKPIIVGQENELSFSYSRKDASCPEKADGEISININQFADYHKGPASCCISLDGNNINNTSGKFTWLDNQTYHIIINDFCTSKEQSVDIGEQNVVSVIISSSLDPACKSIPDGTITAVASGSTNAYDFELYESSNLIRKIDGSQVASITFGTLPGGNYTVKSRSDQCISFLKSDQKILAAVLDIDFTSTITDVKCFGTGTGEIKITPTGGTPQYHYQLGNNPLSDNNEFSSLPAGTYQVSVHTRDLTCSDFKSRNITVNSSPKIQIGIDADNATCFEKADGSLKANVAGGSGAYSFSWQEYIGGNWYLKQGNSELLTGLYAARYRINVTDSYNCPMSAEGVVSEPTLLVVESAFPKDAVCFGENGSVTVIASGGSGGYEYSCHEDAGQVYKATVPQINLPAGNYYVTVKDAHGCEAVYDDYSDIKVTAPGSPLDFTYTAQDYHGFNLRCNSDESGEVRIVATGGNGSNYSGYKYSLTGFTENTTGMFTGLSAGSYSMKVADGRGCTVQKPLNLSEPSQLNLALVSTETVKCFGASTGEIRVSATGGIPGTYKYKLDGTEMLSPGIFGNLPADTYEVEATDINGCSQNLFATVQSLNPPIGIVAIPEDVRCYGENNGKINTIVSGGSGGFTYSWEINPGSGWQPFGAASGNITGLSPAKYRIKATDSESCFEYRESEIKEPSRIIVSRAVPKDVVCFGGKGSISISASGGTPVYTYYCRERSGTVYDSPLAELQLPAGIFDVSVRDGKGCRADYSGDISITSPSSALDFTTILSSYNGFNVSCSGKNDGYVIAEASGGNGAGYSGYKYSIDGSPRAENRFNNLVKGSYMISITDARGCKTGKTVILNEPEPLTASIAYSNPVRCFGESTGEFSVTAGGGVQNSYKFKLNGEGDFYSGTFTNLIAGTYKVDVTDLNGCSKSIQTTINNKNSPISTQLASDDVRCRGENNGSIISMVSGGAGEFTYEWKKKSGSGWQNIQTGGSSAGNLVAGFYRLNLRDADNCLASDSIAVIEPSGLEISRLSINDAVCFNDKGSFEIEAQGGNGGYTFYLTADEGKSYNQYNSGNLLVPASYRIKVKDLKGCELTETEPRAITKPDSPLDFKYNLSHYGDYNISCHGNNDGSVSLEPSGGNGNGYSGYLFKLDGSDVNSAIIKKLEARSYEVSLIDGRGCRIAKNITLSEPASIMKLQIVSVEQPKCVYDKTGSVSLFAEGGNQPYEFCINGNPYESSSAFSGLAVAHYNFKVRDSNGCSESIDTSLVNLVSEMIITGIISDVKCNGESSGSIDVQVSEGSGPYTFKWNDSFSVSSSRSSLRKGVYTVSVTDAGGCLSDKSFIISEPAYPLRITALSSAACAELKNGVIKATALGGTPPYRFAVDRKSGYDSVSLFDAYQGNHNVFVSDLNSCLSETQVLVGVRNIKPDINFMLATSRYELDTLVMIDVSVPVPDKVKWEFPDGTTVIDTTKHKAMIKYTQAGLYPVKMTGKFGTCTYTIDKILDISPFDPLVSNEEQGHKGIKTVLISPNPNDGKFIVYIELYTKQEIAVKVFDFYSRVQFSEKWPADISFRKEINIPENAVPGNYVLWIIGEYDSRPLIFVISR